MWTQRNQKIEKEKETMQKGKKKRKNKLTGPRPGIEAVRGAARRPISRTHERGSDPGGRAGLTGRQRSSVFRRGWPDLLVEHNVDDG
jgi:hypothetical protein